MGVESAPVPEALSAEYESVVVSRVSPRTVEAISLPVETFDAQERAQEKETAPQAELQEEYVEEETAQEEEKGLWQTVGKNVDVGVDWLEDNVWPFVKNHIPSIVRVGIGSVSIIAGFIFLPFPTPFGVPLIFVGLALIVGPKNAWKRIKKVSRQVADKFSKKDTEDESAEKTA